MSYEYVVTPNNKQMKKLFLLLPLLFLPAPVVAQQVNQFGVCTQYQEDTLQEDMTSMETILQVE